MKIGSIGYIISLISIGICFIYSLNSYILLAFILIFIASHAIGQGTVIWVFISEIFPNSVRAKGQSLGTATHWIFAALITALTPYVINMLGNNPGMIFYFFGFNHDVFNNSVICSNLPLSLKPITPQFGLFMYS